MEQQMSGKESNIGLSDSNAGLGLQIVIRNDVLVGIRDSGGFLLFFPSITKYEGQESRYKDEFKTQKMLADFILSTLKAA